MKVSIVCLIVFWSLSGFSQSSDTAVIQQLDSVKNEVPLEFNHQVRGEILEVTNFKSSKNKATLRRFLQYDEELKTVFLENAVPLELRYACISMSNCNLTETNENSRQGFFNITYPVAKKYGMTLTNYIDERMDVVKSATVFCKELKELHLESSDWRVAITQYNSDPEGWAKARKLTKDTISDFWKTTNYLPSESRSTYPKYVAAVYLGNFYKTLGYTVKSFDLATEKVLITEYTTLYQLASKLGIDFQLLKELNPVYKRNIVPHTNEDYYLNIPANRIDEFNDLGEVVYQYSSIPVYTNTEVKIIERTIRDTIEVDGFPIAIPEDSIDFGDYSDLIYAVRNGDILLKIADLYDCEVVQIQRWNNMSGESLSINQKLKIKVPTTSLPFYSKIDKMTTEQRRVVSKRD